MDSTCAVFDVLIQVHGDVLRLELSSRKGLQVKNLDEITEAETLVTALGQ